MGGTLKPVIPKMEINESNQLEQLNTLVFNFRISVPYPFQWGAPTFNAGEAFAMMAASFVALVEVNYIIVT